MPDSSDGSITRWLHLLAAGDHDAARKLWEFFAPRLNQLARARLRTLPQGGVFDEEDIVQSAFAIFCQQIQEGRYPDIKDRNELWQLLAVFTSRRAAYHLERLQTQKRSGLKPPEDVVNEVGSRLERVVDDGLEVDHQLIADDLAGELIKALGDPELEAVAIMRLQGFTNDEIADKLQLTRRTIQRMLNLIRARWQKRFLSDEPENSAP